MLLENNIFVCLMPEPKFASTEPVVKTLEERCQKALKHVGCGLSCLQYFKNLNPQCVDEENMVCNIVINILCNQF